LLRLTAVMAHCSLKFPSWAAIASGSCWLPRTMWYFSFEAPKIAKLPGELWNPSRYTRFNADWSLVSAPYSML